MYSIAFQTTPEEAASLKELAKRCQGKLTHLTDNRYRAQFNSAIHAILFAYQQGSRTEHHDNLSVYQTTEHATLSSLQKLNNTQEHL